MAAPSASSPRRLLLVLGDQLDYERFLPQDFEPSSDLFWLAEASEESTHVRSNKHRIVCFLAAMRHFRNHLQKEKLPLLYHELGEGETTLGQLLAKDLDQLKTSGLSSRALWRKGHAACDSPDGAAERGPQLRAADHNIRSTVPRRNCVHGPGEGDSRCRRRGVAGWVRGLAP